MRAFDASERNLGTHVDVYMIHWPRAARNQFVGTWRAFVELRDQGRVRTIGVSTPILMISALSDVDERVRGLRAGYGKAEVLSGLDLKLPQGSVVTVIGPNGAGKSTTLNALMGILPASGAITFDGRDIIEFHPHAPA